MGFSWSEVRSILSTEYTYALTAGEFRDIRDGIEDTLSDFDDSLDSADRDMNIALMRMDQIQNDLLGIYQRMLQHYTASQQGQDEFDDGTPVFHVKPADIVSLGERIIKLDQDRISARLQYPSAKAASMQALAATQPAQQLQLPSSSDFADTYDVEEKTT